MNAMKNRVQLIGHVGNEPEIKTFDGGKKLANLTIATNDTYRNDKGDKVEQTEMAQSNCLGKNSRHHREIRDQRQGSSHRRQTHSPQLRRQEWRRTLHHRSDSE